jgi:DNA-binding NarL/FixJ family response regulator
VNIKLNLKVLIIDHDFFAQQAMMSLLGWDRRTRVISLEYDLAGALRFIHQISPAEWPDVVLMEPEAFETAKGLREAIRTLTTAVPEVIIQCLGHRPDPELVKAAAESGVKAYMLRNDVKLRLVGVLCHALDHEFTVTENVPYDHLHLSKPVEVVHEPQEYPGMTERIRQALWLCVINGMPAQLAADEMAVSPHTIRSYIKAGYRILEAHDSNDYPDEMGPLERAFMRFTALSDDDLDREDESE